MATKKRPITVDDLYRLSHIESPQVSPDGQWIAFVRVTVDKLDNGYKRNIWLVKTSGSDPMQITRSGKDSSPEWSPDGQTLAFVSSRSDKPQIYLLPMTAPGGEARALTSHENGAHSPAWSPDGKNIAFLASMNANERAKEDSGEKDPEPADKFEAEQREKRKEYDEKMRWDPRPMWRIPYRAGTSFLDDRYAQVYVLPTAEGLKDDESKPRRLTDFDGHYDTPCWSNDGKYIYTARTGDPTADEPFLKNHLYRIKVSDGAHDQLTDGDVADFIESVSPDGKWVAFTRTTLPIDTLTKLAVIPAGGGEVKLLNVEIDRSPGTVDWAGDDQLIVSFGDTGDSVFYTLDAKNGSYAKLFTGGFVAESANTSSDGGVAFAASTPLIPGELYWKAAGSNDYQQMTSFNKDFLDEVFVQETHEFRFQSPGGEIQGWYILPVGYEKGKTYPLALNIHGGPHVMWSPSARSMWHEWQFHAASGYAVFFCNPRGGDGYGEKFQNALHSDWGNVAFTDIMAGVDAFLKLGIADEKRMAVTGGSYGGYMTAWVVGHTDRFAAAVTQRGVYNLASFYGTSDVPILISSEFDVEPWENYEKLWAHSPLAYAQNIKTPLLIIHAENDYRVPIEQAEQLFAFVRRGTDTPVKMMRYPRDGHELSRSGEPKHRVSRLTEMVKWFDEYCKK